MNKTVYKKGFIDRREKPLPSKIKLIQIIQEDSEGEHKYLCEWIPYNKENYKGKYPPGKGYLGTAEVVKGQWKGIGYHAWEQNKHEFIYYKIIK